VQKIAAHVAVEEERQRGQDTRNRAASVDDPREADPARAAPARLRGACLRSRAQPGARRRTRQVAAEARH
jgi:hypothetical protein